MSLKVISGGHQPKVCTCSVCTKKFKSGEQGHSDAMIWLTLGRSAGFQTDEFDICGMCAAHLLIELRAYVNTRVGIKKK